MTDKTDSKEREALVAYLQDCDEKAIVPDVAGAWHAAFQSGRASLAASAVREPVAWPKDAAEVREFFRSDFIRAEYVADDHQPCDEDRYYISAHDFLSAINWWADFPHHPSPPEGMVGGWISVEDARKPPPGKPVVLWVWAERYQEDDDGRQIAQDASGLHLGEWREAEHGNYFDNYSTPFADREAALWWMDPAPPTSSADSRKGE